MKDIDLTPYIPDSNINNMDMRSFKLPSERKLERSKYETESIHT